MAALDAKKTAFDRVNRVKLFEELTELAFLGVKVLMNWYGKIRRCGSIVAKH